MSFSAFDLRCESQVDPLGCDFALPRLSWKLSAEKGERGTCQSAYRIQAGSLPGLADLWDSEKVQSDQSVFIPWGGPKLLSRQRVYWRVKVWDSGDKPSKKWSDDAFFELGLLKPADWRSAKWIGGPLVGGPHTSIPLPRLSRTFTLSKPIASARLYVTALGVYEASLNGQKVGEAELSPGWTSYFSRVRYQTRDVTKLLHEGENALVAELGDGWAVGHIGWRERGTYAERPKLLALLIVAHPDGSETLVRSDNKWQVSYGPRLAADLLMGEHYDARLPWTSLGAASVFPAPELKLDAQNGPEVKVTEILKPVRKPYRHGGSWIFDLGINLVGRIKLTVKGEAGTTIKLRYAEVLEKGPLATDGPIYTTNLRAAVNTDYYTLSGESSGEVFESKFTFHGFRYVELSGFPGEPTEKTIEGLVLHSECDKTGDFECSDPLINQLQKNIDWGWRGNSLDVPTDCPQRDERLGWTGDAQVFCRTSCFLRETGPFWHKWMGDLRDSQGPNGELPPVAPFFSGALPQDGGAAWADAGVIVPWTIYLAYGDQKILTDNYDLMKRFVNFWISTAKENLRCYPGYEKQGWMGFGDWLALDGSGKTDGGTPKELIATAYLAYSAKLFSKIADVLGKNSDARKYQSVFEKTKAAFLKRYVSPEGFIAPMTQTAGVIALHFELIPESLRPKVAEWVVRDIESRGGKTTCGFVGSSYQPHVLTEVGALGAAETLLFQKGWPSYLYAVTMGATTIWERWDGWTPEKGFQDAGMNSFNHYAYGAVGSWLYEKIAGLDTDEAAPGYKKLILRPRILDGLTHARATLQTPYGAAESHWEKKKKALVWKITVPPNTTARVYLPVQGDQKVTESGKSLDKSVGVHSLSENSLELISGTYEFEIK